MNLPLPARAYLLAVAAGAAGLLGYWLAAWREPAALVTLGLVAPSPEQLALVAVLVAAAVVAQHFSLLIAPRRKVDVSIGLYFADLLLFGAPAAMILVAVSQLLGQGTLALRRNPLTAKRLRSARSVVFNTGQCVLATGLGGLVYFAALPHQAPAALDRPANLWALPAAALAMYLANSLAVAGMVALQQRRALFAVWRTGRHLDLLHYAAVFLIGLAIALTALAYPWGPLVLLLALVLVYLALQRLVAALAGEQEARAAAEQAVRARGEFLAIASHELRTPITSLRGYAQLLLRRSASGALPDPARVRRALAVIDRQSDRLARLVAQLLDVSRIQDGTLVLDRQPTDLALLVQEVAAMFRDTSTHALLVHAPAPVWALVDPLRLEQVVVNLIENAVKYSVDTSPIELDVRQLDAEMAQIAVRDRGIGIPPEHQLHVFERFYQVDGSTHVGGMGLGLYISRQIVGAHGGRIEVQSPPGGGTRFVITVPAGRPETTPADPPALTPNATPGEAAGAA